MGSSSDLADWFRERIKVELRKRTYLTEPQERELMHEAVEAGMSLKRAQQLLGAVLSERRTRGTMRELRSQHDIAAILETLVGDKNWLSRTNFDRLARLHCELSGGTILLPEANIRVKQLMAHRGCKIRGETIFGTPAWFRTIPQQLPRDSSEKP